MQAAQHGSAPVVVLTKDSDLLDHVLAGAAVARLDPELVPDVGDLRAMWSLASMVLVGVDQAPAVSRLALPRRTEVYLIGDETRHAEARRWSVRLGAAVIILPGDTALLESAMADLAGQREGGSRLLAIVGGAGGAGASTIAAGLCFAASLLGRRSLLLDCDPFGGGIDLLVGAERIDGWRWPRLAGAKGHLGDLHGQLPVADGVDVLAMGRRAWPAGSSPATTPGAEQLTAVLSSAGRSHDLIVADLPRGLGEGPLAVLRRADLALVVVPADLRGVAASRELSAELVAACASVGVLVRRSRVGRISADAMADGLGLPVLGVVADEPALRAGAERGDPPGRSPRSPLGRICRALIAKQLSTGVAA
jgi:secretion/DNA translocation related CpaE-like protein